MQDLIPYRTPVLITRAFTGLVWKGDSEDLFLTFDDGPVPGITENILEMLDGYGIKATFFCVGENAGKYPGIMKKLIEGGHRVGNHTFNHLNGWHCDTHTYWENVAKCQTILDPFTNAGDRKLFRPPHGRLSISQFQKLRHHYKIVMWTVLTEDFNAAHALEYSLKKSIKATGHGSIILFHDSIKSEKKTLYMLPRFIEHFLAQDFKFKRL